MKNLYPFHTSTKMKTQLLRFTVFLVILLSWVGFTQKAWAIAYSWNGSVSTNWADSTNWSPAGVPGAGDDVTIVAAANGPLLAANTTIQYFKITSGTLNLGGFTLSVTGNADIFAGTISNGLLSATGPATTFGQASTNGRPTIHANITVVSAQVYVGLTTFNGVTSLTKTGTGNNIAYGSNTFNGKTELVNQSTAVFAMGQNTPDVFKGDLTLTCTAAGFLYIANGAANTLIDTDITLNSTAGGWINIGAWGGSSRMTAGHTIRAGSTPGLTSARLIFRKFTLEGTVPLQLNLAGGVGFDIGAGCVIYPDVNCSAGGIYLNGATYYGVVNYQKTGTISDCRGAGGNRFYKKVTLRNWAYSQLSTGYSSADEFHGDVELESQGGYGAQMFIAHAGKGTIFKGNIILNCGSSWGMHFGNGGGTSTLESNGRLIIGTAGYKTNGLTLAGFTQQGAASAHTLELTDGASFTVGPNSSFAGPLSVTAPWISLNGCTFLQDVTFIRTAIHNYSSDSKGGNTFKGKVTLINRGGPGALKMATQANDVVTK